jgi:hypothetical protein
VPKIIRTFATSFKTSFKGAYKTSRTDHLLGPDSMVVGLKIAVSGLRGPDNTNGS